MMKWTDFRWTRKVEYYSEESLFYNKEVLGSLLRRVNYYEKGFLNNTQVNRLGSKVYNGKQLVGFLNGATFKNLFTNSMLRRIEVMADYLYDEGAYALRDEDRKVDHEKNLRITTAILLFELFLYYSQALVTITNAKHADKIAKKCFYDIVSYVKTEEDFDEIIMEGNKRYDDEMIKTNPKHERNVYEWDQEREFILISTFLRRNLDNSYNVNLVNTIAIQYMHMIGKTALEFEKHKPESVAHDIIKKCILDLNSLSLDIEIKSRMMNKLNSLFDETIFDAEKEAELVRAALSYSNNRRPTMKCEKLFNENKEKYNYKGIVYHGFRDIGFGCNPRNLLQDYHDGFISCSKDLAIAAEFSGWGEYNDEYDTSHGRPYNDGLYVLEILIDENVEAIDIEQLLKDSYEKYPGKYENMFKSYMREKEVLLKLPMVSYNILSQEEVEKRLYKARQDKWQTYKKVESTTAIAAPMVTKPQEESQPILSLIDPTKVL